MKIQLLKKEKHFEKKEFILNSNFYWKIAVTLACIIILMAASFGYYLFIQTSQDTAIITSAEGEKIPIVKTQNLEKALKYFNEKEQKSSQILNSPTPVVDPSL